MWPDWAIFWTLDNFLKPLAAINLPQSSPFLGNYCKGVIIIHFSSETIFGQLLQTFGDFYLVTLLVTSDDFLFWSSVGFLDDSGGRQQQPRRKRQRRNNLWNGGRRRRRRQLEPFRRKFRQPGLLQRRRDLRRSPRVVPHSGYYLLPISVPKVVGKHCTFISQLPFQS